MVLTPCLAPPGRGKVAGWLAGRRKIRSQRGEGQAGVDAMVTDTDTAQPGAVAMVTDTAVAMVTGTGQPGASSNPRQPPAAPSGQSPVDELDEDIIPDSPPKPSKGKLSKRGKIKGRRRVSIDPNVTLVIPPSPGCVTEGSQTVRTPLQPRPTPQPHPHPPGSPTASTPVSGRYHPQTRLVNRDRSIDLPCTPIGRVGTQVETPGTSGLARRLARKGSSDASMRKSLLMSQLSVSLSENYTLD